MRFSTVEKYANMIYYKVYIGLQMCPVSSQYWNHSLFEIHNSCLLLPVKNVFDTVIIFQEQLRKRKEEEDRLAAQTEFLNRSLRGSRKLQALESRPHGTINDAFDVEDEEHIETSVQAEKELVHVAYGKNGFYFQSVLTK